MPNRKAFLGAAALAALASQLQPAGAATPAPAKTPGLQPLNFSLAPFDALLARPAAHRHLFASTKISDGTVLDAMHNTVRAYTDVGIDAGQVFPVAVLYHGVAIALAFDDAAWNQWLIPALPKYVKDEHDDLDDLKPGKGNPFLHRADQTDGNFDASIDSLVAQAGAHFFVCDHALRGLSGSLADKQHLSQTHVYDSLTKALIPSASVVPAGVWAVHAIQERRFTYLQTTL